MPYNQGYLDMGDVGRMASSFAPILNVPINRMNAETNRARVGLLQQHFALKTDEYLRDLAQSKDKTEKYNELLAGMARTNPAEAAFLRAMSPEDGIKHVQERLKGFTVGTGQSRYIPRASGLLGQPNQAAGPRAVETGLLGEAVSQEPKLGAFGGVPGTNTGQLGMPGYDIIRGPKKPPTMQTRYQGTTAINERWNPTKGEFEEVGRGPRFSASGGTGTPTLAQRANNTEIRSARDRIRRLREGLGPGETLRGALRSRMQKATNTGRENPNYDPFIERDFRTASNRMVGEDPGYAEFNRLLDDEVRQPKSSVPVPRSRPSITPSRLEPSTSSRRAREVVGRYVPPADRSQPAFEAETSHIPQAAIDYLKRNPGLAEQFEEKYGPGTARAVLRN